MPTEPINVFTIGFTKTTAGEFFEKLRAGGVIRVVDVRLNNRSQLAGFSKRDDLQYLLKEILGVQYVEEPLLAPTREIRDAYKTKNSWHSYERDFLRLMEERRIEKVISSSVLAGACLLCSEHEPNNCHRRLVAEYLQRKWKNIKINHLF